MKYLELQKIFKKKITDIKTFINEMSYIYSDTANTDKKLVQVNSFCQEIIKNIQLSNATLNKKITITTQLGISESFIEIDSFQVERAINNIIDNMLEYRINNSEVILKVEEKRLYMVFNNDFEIKPFFNQKNIFDLYYSSNDNTAKEHLGLGLYIVKNIMDANNGSVEVSMEDNIFYLSIWIPLIRRLE